MARHEGQALWPRRHHHFHRRHLGRGGLTAYGAAKAGTIGLAKSLAHEGQGVGIKVNAVAPGARTAMSAAMFADGSGWRWRPENVSPLVVYLASEACRHNGEIFSAMAGHFARVATVQGAGAKLDSRDRIIPEHVMDAMPEIEAMAGAAALSNGLGEVVRQASVLHDRPSA